MPVYNKISRFFNTPFILNLCPKKGTDMDKKKILNMNYFVTRLLTQKTMIPTSQVPLWVCDKSRVIIHAGRVINNLSLS